MRTGSPLRSISATTWCATICWPRSSRRWCREARVVAEAPCGRSGIVTLRSVILGAGCYLPERVLTNAELASQVDTSDDWIVQRTGIRERHIAADGEFTSDLGIKAAQAALADAGLDAAGYRSDRVRDLDARQHLSGHRRLDPGRAWHHRRLRLRSAGGLLGLRLWPRHRRRHAAHRSCQARAADRRGDLLAHSRLDRSHHLRAVRRRRRCGGDRGAGAARRA